MPNRIIRESALTSDTLAVLSDAEERLWWRLILVADDHGRFDADATTLASRCFPRNRRLLAARVEEWLRWIAETGALALYEVNGHRYGVFVNWPSHQRVRESKPKYPAPPEEALAEAQARAAALTAYMRQPAASCGEWRRLAASGGDSRQPAATRGDLRPSRSRSRSRRYGVVAVGMESGVVAGAGVVPPSPSGDVRRTATGYDVPPELLALWEQDYPGVNVQHELRAAWQWEAADPKRRKIRIRAFLVNWLKRAQDRSRPPPAKPVGETVAERAKRYEAMLTEGTS